MSMILATGDLVCIAVADEAHLEYLNYNCKKQLNNKYSQMLLQREASERGFEEHLKFRQPGNTHEETNRHLFAAK
jgi:hypothetical protein